MEHNDLIDLIRNRYLSNHKENTLKHAEEVADTAIWLAEMINYIRRLWLIQRDFY